MIDFERMNISTSQLDKLVDEWIYDERDRLLVKRKLMGHKTYEQVAEEFEISPRTAITIVHRGLDIIVRHIDCK